MGEVLFTVGILVRAVCRYVIFDRLDIGFDAIVDLFRDPFSVCLAFEAFIFVGLIDLEVRFEYNASKIVVEVVVKVFLL